MKKLQKSSSPVRRLPGSPARSAEATRAARHQAASKLSTSPQQPGHGAIVVAYLREPREQSWGVLLKLEDSGVWLRGIELDSFESWSREVARGEPGFLGLSTLFVPLHRVEKLVVDERSGPVPSLAERFQQITGRSAGEFLANS